MADVGEIIRGTLEYSVPNASQALNVFHWVVAGAGSDDDDVVDGIEAFILNDWGPSWVNLASTSSSILSVTVDVVSASGLVERALGAAIITLVGSHTGGASSAAIAAYMLLKTALPKIKGVKYVPGIADAIVDDGALDGAGFASLAILLLDYAKTVSIQGGTELIPGVASTSLVQFVPFLDTGLIESIPAYQRRRKPNVGS